MIWFWMTKGTSFKIAYKMTKKKAIIQEEKRHFVQIINLSLTFRFVRTLESYWYVSVHLQGNCVSFKKRQFEDSSAEFIGVAK